MPETLNSDHLQEKNQLASVYGSLYLYIIYDYDGEGNNLRFTNDDENTTFNSLVYSAGYVLGHSNISRNAQGKINSVSVTFANANREMEYYVQNYSFKYKKIAIINVYKNNLLNSDAYTRDIYFIKSHKSNEGTLVFECSTKTNILDIPIPLYVIQRNYCHWAWNFKGAECGYAGAETTCDGTKQRCRELNNVERFEGCPGA